MLTLNLTSGPLSCFSTDPGFGIPQPGLWAPASAIPASLVSSGWQCMTQQPLQEAPGGSTLPSLPAMSYHCSNLICRSRVNSPPARLVSSKCSILLGPLTQATIHQNHQKTLPPPESPAPPQVAAEAAAHSGLFCFTLWRFPGPPVCHLSTPRPPYLSETNDQFSVSLSSPFTSALCYMLGFQEHVVSDVTMWGCLWVSVGSHSPEQMRPRAWPRTRGCTFRKHCSREVHLRLWISQRIGKGLWSPGSGVQAASVTGRGFRKEPHWRAAQMSCPRPLISSCGSMPMVPPRPPL